MLSRGGRCGDLCSGDCERVCLHNLTQYMQMQDEGTEFDYSCTIIVIDALTFL